MRRGILWGASVLTATMLLACGAGGGGSPEDGAGPGTDLALDAAPDILPDLPPDAVGTADVPFDIPADAPLDAPPVDPALAALQQPDKTKVALEAMLAAFDRRRKLLHSELNRIPRMSCLLAQGAFYLFPNISRFGLPSQEFCARLLESEKVAAVNGSAFGAEGYMRLSYATSDAIIAKGVERLRRFCAGLAGS